MRGQPLRECRIQRAGEFVESDFHPRKVAVSAQTKLPEA